ncbi:MAG: hypothetical protein ACLGIJ_01640 [Candidatus Limnocylindria bacterium]
MSASLEDLALVAARPLLRSPIGVVFRLAPGDRPLVAVGETVVPGSRIAERLRDATLSELPSDRGSTGAPGERVAAGELLFRWRDRWRVAGGEIHEPLETPVAGIVREVRPGSAIVLAAEGRALVGVTVLGGSARGRLALGPARDGESRARSLDVGSAGTILVVGSRVDAEMLTRARAMGVRGIVVSGLASKERRDFGASESRQRAALHRLAPFAVLVVDGATRRPLPSAVMAILGALVGRDVAIVDDPPALIVDDPRDLPLPPPDHVRIRAGALGGREGRFEGLLGPRRFAGGVRHEAARVRLTDGSAVAVPLGDLERYV